MTKFKIVCSRSKSTDRSGRTPDVDISMEAEGPGSSLATTTIPDMDRVSVGSSSFNTADKTMSDILLPPLLPESRSLVHMRKLKSLDKVSCRNLHYGENFALQFLMI